MAENTNIAWATHTWSPWLGCTKVSAGCKHCYAETLMDTRYRKVQWGPGGTRVKTSDSYWKKPLAWDKAAAESGEQFLVFPSLCDVFEDWPGPIVDSKGAQFFINDQGIPYRCDGLTPSDWTPPLTMNHVRAGFFNLIDATPHLTWLILTKRPENIGRMWPVRQCCGYDAGGLLPHCSGCGKSLLHRPNLWLGVSVEDQETADARIPELLKYRAYSPVRWVSYEPALGPVDFTNIPFQSGTALHRMDALRGYGGWDRPRWECKLDWVIVGGESGHEARAFDVEWARSAIRQCRLANVACFVKQLGDNTIGTIEPSDGLANEYFRFGRLGKMKDPKGENPEEWPEDMRVREFPAARKD